MPPRCGARSSDINAGITGLVDWAHIINTPDHADAGIKALQETGIRSVYAYRLRQYVARRLVVRSWTTRAARCGSTGRMRAGSASSTSTRTMAS